MFERSYLSKDFTIANADARLRRADDLMAFETSNDKKDTARHRNTC